MLFLPLENSPIFSTLVLLEEGKTPHARNLLTIYFLTYFQPQNFNAMSTAVKTAGNGQATAQAKKTQVATAEFDALKAELAKVQKAKEEAEQLAKKTAEQEKQNREALQSLKKELETLKAKHEAEKEKSIEQVKAELAAKKKLFTRLEELEKVKTRISALDFNENAARQPKLEITDTEGETFTTHNLSVIHQFVKLVKDKADEHIVKTREELKNA